MREVFFIALSLVGTKGEDQGVIHIALTHIVSVIKDAKGITQITLSNGNTVLVKEGIEELNKRGAQYGLVRMI